ncbi:hypothetical protein EI165_10595 [Pseudoalteromonas nigrifaciens]|uniref:hypothetical protein n=1 Tax=Pseudoalteromonas nigrifaciens TaxID=28109 RepID=UPI00178851B5|nr:hypothetical protein [Pseudoalteromonas nigrifaciens]MBE0420569.1 hypothetical protein [Pseudoalteromonas nigrifaciens]
MSKLKVKVIHSIPLHLGKGETVEAAEGESFSGCEWRYIDDTGVLVHQSEDQYGNPMAVLRDGLVTVIGLPNEYRMRKIERVRDKIATHFK